MKRDWINVGRRPSGLCGAAILISARCHGFKRTTKQIVNVVHVCDETIRRRLDEFSRTDAAKMSKEEFDKIVILKDYEEGGMDPPCYKRCLTDEYKQFVNKKASEIESVLNAEDDNKTSLIKESNIQFQNTHIPLISVYNSGMKENIEIKYSLRKNSLHKRTWENSEKCKIKSYFSRRRPI